jgi:hypothetical protein
MMKNKYDWSKVPSDVEFITTDSDGRIKGFDGEPMMGIAKNGSGNFHSNYEYYDLTKLLTPYQGNWQDSIELRPKGENA